MLISDPLPTPSPMTTVSPEKALAIARRDQNFGPATQRRAEMVANARCIFLIVIDAETGSADYVAQLCS